MGTCGWVDNLFYLDRRVAANRSPQSQEWMNYIVKELEVDLVNFNTVRFDGEIFGLNTDNGDEVVKKNALAKLTEEEKKILNLNE